MALCLGTEAKTVNRACRYDYRRATFEVVSTIVEMYGGAALGDEHQLREQYMSVGFYLPKILAAARLNALYVQGVSLQERG